MNVSRAGGLVVVASVALALTACSAGPEEKPMPTTPVSSSSTGPQDPNLSEPISQLATQADVIVYGTVEKVDPAVTDPEQSSFPTQTAQVRVSGVLKGDAPAEITVVKPAGTWYFLADQAQESRDAKHEGILVLKKSGDGFELFGYVGLHDDSAAPRTFARVLAGGPEHVPAATTAQLAEWAAKADIVVFARAKGSADHVTLHTPRVDFSSSGTLTPITVLKGEMPGPLQVVQGPQPDVAGGTWGFPVTDEGQTGVFFIDTSGDVPVVLNTTEPSAINRRQVPLGK